MFTGWPLNLESWKNIKFGKFLKIVRKIWNFKQFYMLSTKIMINMKI